VSGRGATSFDRDEGEARDFELAHGAWWLLPDGRCYAVHGFHDAWIRERQELVPGCRDLRDVVTKLGWFAVGVYAEGSVEYIVASLGDRRTRERIADALGRGEWSYAVAMALDDDAIVRIEPGGVGAFVDGSQKGE
jgi:hypothetical protein